MENSSSTAIGALIGASIAIGVAAVVNHIKNKETDQAEELALNAVADRAYTQGYYEGRESVIAPWARRDEEKTAKIPTQQ